MNVTASQMGQEVVVPDTGLVRAISFESPTLGDLGRQVAGWIAEHPSATVISFSHAVESRQVVPFPASLAGPRPTAIYTGILLVHV